MLKTFKKLIDPFKKLIDPFKRFINYLVTFSDKAWHKSLFNYVSYLSVIMILLAYSGVILINPKYVNLAHAFILYYVCLILLIRFNPYSKKSHLVKFDKTVAFTAGILLFTSTIATHLFTDLF